MPARTTNEINPEVPVEIQPMPVIKGFVDLPNAPDAPKEFRCPRCQGNRFHRAEHMGKLMLDGKDVAFITTELSYRCVFCHGEYNEQDIVRSIP